MFRLLTGSGGIKLATYPQSLLGRTLIVKKPLKLVQSRDAIHAFSASSVNSPSRAYRRVGTFDDAVTRSKDSSEVQTSVAELPEIPRLSSRKRAFHIHPEDLEALVRPLLSCHWHVGRVGDVVEEDDAAHRVFCLNKLFTLKNFRTMVEFFDALAEVQKEERHHARVTVDYANVYISTHTHEAYEHPSSDADVGAKPIEVAGLSARDIRFAVKVERLHEMFLGDGRAVTKVPADAADLQTWSMEQLRRRYSAPK